MVVKLVISWYLSARGLSVFGDGLSCVPYVVSFFTKPRGALELYVQPFWIDLKVQSSGLVWLRRTPNDVLLQGNKTSKTYHWCAGTRPLSSFTHLISSYFKLYCNNPAAAESAASNAELEKTKDSCLKWFEYICVDLAWQHVGYILVVLPVL